MMVFALIFLAVLASVERVAAQTWFENGDAGDLPSSAQFTYGSGALTEIQGSLSSDSDVDMYCIKVAADHAIFSAMLTCTVISGNDIWIFHSNGPGLGEARDRGCQGAQTRVGSPIVNAPGTYYLAISGHDASAMSGVDAMWLLGVPASGQVAPNGPGAAGAVTSWQGGVANPVGAYTIHLVGAEFCDTPLPARLRTWGETKVIYR
jgi:hypothetical protein